MPIGDSCSDNWRELSEQSGVWYSPATVSCGRFRCRGRGHRWTAARLEKTSNYEGWKEKSSQFQQTPETLTGPYLRPMAGCVLDADVFRQRGRKTERSPTGRQGRGGSGISSASPRAFYDPLAHSPVLPKHSTPGEAWIQNGEFLFSWTLLLTVMDRIPQVSKVKKQTVNDWHSS